MLAQVVNETREMLLIPQEPRNWYCCLITVTWRDEQRRRRRSSFEGIAGTCPAAERLAEANLARWKAAHVPEPYPF